MSAAGPGRIRLYENLRTVSYAPFYLAQAMSLYRRHGLDVEVVTSPRPSETARGLVAGRVDVSWGGPMRVMLEHDRDPGCPLVCFCQVVARDPFVLVGRRSNPGFRFRDLVGPTVGVVAEVPTPWMTLYDDLDRAGIDPGSLQRGPDRSMAENVAALHAGEVDVAQVMEPWATLAVREGRAHVWHEFAIRGPIAFTTFYTTRRFTETRPQACRALTATLREAVGIIHSQAPAATAAAIAEWFADLPDGVLADAIDRYRRAGLWSNDPSIPVRDLARLKAALLAGGLIGTDVAYDAVVDDRFALEAGNHD